MTEPGGKLDGLAHSVLGAAIEVPRAPGPGFLESVYEEALCIELEARNIPFWRPVPTNVRYPGRLAGESRLDRLIDELLILELKAVEPVPPIHRAIVISDLKGTKRRLARLINSRLPVLKNGIERTI